MFCCQRGTRAEFLSFLLCTMTAAGPRHRSLALNTNISPKEFELDDDVLDDDALEALRTPHRQRALGGHLRVSSRGGGEQATPLLVGLVDASAYRSPDTPRGTSYDVDLETLATKRLEASGGMLDSIANMANSILGAGAHESETIPVLLKYL